MRVAILTSEAMPFAKTGGLADVSGALPKALVEQDVDAKLILPLYEQVDRELSERRLCRERSRRVARAGSSRSFLV